MIRKRFGVSYHNHHVPWVLHKLGFSVQRPRKRLARADKEKQEVWLKKRFPAIKKKPPSAAASTMQATASHGRPLRQASRRTKRAKVAAGIVRL